MSKESIAVINGHEYKYRYNKDTGGMDYLGPLGEAPALTQEEFLRKFNEEKIIYDSLKSHSDVESIKARVDALFDKPIYYLQYASTGHHFHENPYYSLVTFVEYDSEQDPPSLMVTQTQRKIRVPKKDRFIVDRVRIDLSDIATVFSDPEINSWILKKVRSTFLYQNEMYAEGKFPLDGIDVTLLNTLQRWSKYHNIMEDDWERRYGVKMQSSDLETRDVELKTEKEYWDYLDHHFGINETWEERSKHKW
jgi:hypothetical protein